MKRTRRIEVISYTRRVTMTEGGNTPAAADGLPAFDITPAALEGEDRPRGAGETSKPQTPRQRLASRLRDLLRLRR